ncbi:hypothetical protein [Rhizobium sp. SG570]|uniref:hypothetical protein n=1 Tax=Rhizobium sp. SG570 TaxID=2587113 RepID=UPI0017D3219E|nr:hypothetical protein [Rhizobium sp. SG570]NKJ39998.1 hypothetical protein [Rhizobium sp. SG570]
MSAIEQIERLEMQIVPEGEEREGIKRWFGLSTMPSYLTVDRLNDAILHRFIKEGIGCIAARKTKEGCQKAKTSTAEARLYIADGAKKVGDCGVA